MRVAIAVASLLWALLASSARAEPTTRVHVLAIGYNGTPQASTAPGLRELRYADDDAVAFARLARDLGGHAIILSAFDADTARRFPDLAQRARLPRLDELRRAVRELNGSFAEDRRQGLEPQLLLTYSGHGVADTGQLPALVLADGKLTQDILYREVLAVLDARQIHLIVDACHAEAVVRPRDVHAETVALTNAELHATLAQLTLRGLPHVGSMIAGSAGAQTHEWERWEQGVFTHQVVSGLRGAADVNADLRVEYSEMAAFLSAANREVSNAAARIKPIVAPPSSTPRASIVDLSARRDAAFLRGRAGKLGSLSIESEDGQRIADLHSEADHDVHLLVPSGRPLYVRGSGGEARITVAAGERLDFAVLKLRDRDVGTRGALDVSLQRGLFATTFGPSYYRGFVDYSGDLMPVPTAVPPAAKVDAALVAPPAARRSPVLAWTGLGVTGALLVTSATMGIAALDARSDFDTANGLEQESFEASQRYKTFGSIALGTAIAGALTGGVTYWLFTQH